MIGLICFGHYLYSDYQASMRLPTTDIFKYHSGVEMVGPQCEQQLYHSSTQLLHPPSQGEAGHMLIVIIQSSTSEYVLFKSNLFSNFFRPQTNSETTITTAIQHCS